MLKIFDENGWSHCHSTGNTKQLLAVQDIHKFALTKIRFAYFQYVCILYVLQVMNLQQNTQYNLLIRY